MKRCKACDEQFGEELASAHFPTPDTRHPIPCLPSCEFRVTMIDNTGLPERLARELRFMIQQMRRAWPAVKRDPIGVGKNAIVACRLRIGNALASPNALTGIVTALTIVLTAAMLVMVSGGFSNQSYIAAKQRATETAELAKIVEFTPDSNVNPHDRGVGAGSQGRVGLANGKGEGSAPELRKSSGGGGGGQHDPLPAQQGRVPPPSPIPAPVPKFPPVEKQALPVAGIDIDPALWANLPMPLYGDPRSKSTSPSNGPGDGGGMGTVNGTGIGEGSGPGFGPGQEGNIGGWPKGLPGGGSLGGSYGNNSDDPDRVYPAQQVSERARVISKPEPQYTEDARRNQITGSVILRVVFSRTGEVTNIRALHSLPFGLTERAIAAARLIRFRPATKDGRPVNVYMQLEYNFNLY
jgi:TonB family protein